MGRPREVLSWHLIPPGGQSFSHRVREPSRCVCPLRTGTPQNAPPVTSSGSGTQEASNSAFPELGGGRLEWEVGEGGGSRRKRQKEGVAQP